MSKFVKSNNPSFGPPHKIINNDDIEQLFTIILDGDQSKINEFKSNKNLSLDLADSNDNGLIHKILEIPDNVFDEQQKLTIIKYLTDHHSRRNNFNKFNVTPLHLAAKYQLKDVVNYFIKNGANKNAVDSQGKTPLHYLAQGDIYECKKPRVTRALIPEKSIKNRYIANLNDITIKLIDILSKNPIFNNYMRHIKLSIDNLDKIYVDDFIAIEDNFLTDISDLLSDVDISDDKKKLVIKKKITDVLNTVTKKIKSKIKTSIKTLPIKPNQLDGWGPSKTNDFLKILPIKSENDYIINIEQKTLVDRTNNLNKLVELNSKLYKIKKNIIPSIVTINQKLYRTAQYLAAYNTRGRQNSLDFSDIRDLILHSKSEMFEFREINIKRGKEKVGMYYTESSTLPSDTNSIKWFEWMYKGKLDPFKIIPLTRQAKKDLKNIAPSANRNDLSFWKNKSYYFVTPPSTGRDAINWALYKTSVGRGNDIKPVPLNLDRTFDGFQYWYISKMNFAFFQIMKHFMILESNIEALNKCFMTGYHYDIYHTLISEIVMTILNIAQNLVIIQEEKTYIKNSNYKIDNIISSGLSKIGNELHNTVPQAIGPRVEYIRSPLYTIDYAQAAFDEVKEGCKNLFKYASQLYPMLFEIHNHLNKVIDDLNKTSALNYMKSYFLESEFSDNFADIDSYFDNPFVKLRGLPESFDKYIELSSGDINEFRKRAYELYIPQVTKYNYQTFYTSNSVYNYGRSLPIINMYRSYQYTRLYQPAIGGITGSSFLRTPRTAGTSVHHTNKLLNYKSRGRSINKDFVVTGNPIIFTRYDRNQPPGRRITRDIVGPSIDNYKIPRIGYLVINQNNFGNPDSRFSPLKPKLEYGERAPRNFTNIPANAIKLQDNRRPRTTNDFLLQYMEYIGRIGYDYQANLQIIKSDSVIPAIGIYLDDHLNILKYAIIKNIIKGVYDIGVKNIYTLPLFRIVDANNPEFIEIKSIFDNLRNNINEGYDIPTQTDSILFTIVAKILDKLIIANITSNILRSSVDKITNILQTTRVRDKHNIMGDIMQNNMSVVVDNIDNGFKLKFNDLFENIVNFYTHIDYSGATPNPVIDRSFDRLKLTKKIMEKDDFRADQFHIFNPNYTLENEISQYMCYSINPDIVPILKSSQNINHQDVTLSTPLHYAIDTLHVDLIKSLVENHAEVSTDSVKNKRANTPWSMILKSYNQHNSILYSDNISKISEKLYNPMYRILLEFIESKKQYKGNVIINLKNIFPMVIFMINHLLYSFIDKYTNNWTYDNINKLFHLFQKYNVADEEYLNTHKIPFLNIQNFDFIDRGSNLGVLNDIDFEITGNIEKDDKIINKLVSQLNSAQKELDDLTQLNKPEYQTRIQFLHEKINGTNTRNGLRQDIASMKGDVSRNKNKRNVLKKNLQFQKKNVKQELINNINDYKNLVNVYDYDLVDKFYDDIFYEVIAISTTKNNRYDLTTGHENYDLYSSLWYSYINDNKRLANPNNIHMLCLLTEKKIINELKRSTDISDVDNIETLNNDLEIIDKLYSDIFIKHINNYFQLPREYNPRSNRVLVSVIDIITHCIKYVVCSNIYFATLKLLTKYVYEISPNKFGNEWNPNNLSGSSQVNYNQYVFNIINHIIDQNITVNHNKLNRPGNKYKDDEPNPKLAKYIMDDIPLKLVKIVLGIFDGSFDPDEDIESISNLLEYIIYIIKDNGIIGIDDDSSLVTGLRNYVLPYYTDIITELIPKLKILVDNYFRYIINEGRYLNITRTMCKSVIEEKKRQIE